MCLKWTKAQHNTTGVNNAFRSKNKIMLGEAKSNLK